MHDLSLYAKVHLELPHGTASDELPGNICEQFWLGLHLTNVSDNDRVVKVWVVPNSLNEWWSHNNLNLGTVYWDLMMQLIIWEGCISIPDAFHLISFHEIVQCIVMELLPSNPSRAIFLTVKPRLSKCPSLFFSIKNLFLVTDTSASLCFTGRILSLFISVFNVAILSALFGWKFSLIWFYHTLNLLHKWNHLHLISIYCW